MTTAPTHRRWRAQAAAGVILPRRPRAAVAVSTGLIAGLLAGLLAVAGCASTSGRAPATTASVFTTQHQVSLKQVDAEVTALYGGHPALASFSVQDVAYTTTSRDTVLRECTTPGPSAGSQDSETGQIVACAPLIFYFYRYGQQASVPAAVTLAGDLYWYAVAHITGPVSAQASLNQLLAGWKLPVPGLTPAQQRTVVAASVVTAADDTLLTEPSVHMVITDQLAGAAGAQRITADMGTVTGTEVIDDGTATATVRVTRQAAYLTGTKAGLTSFFGLPAVGAAKVGSRWVAISAGTSEYQDLAAENTISALPSSILPAASQVSQVSTATVDGQKVYVLDWTTANAAGGPGGAGTTISVRLVLTATPKVLPVYETLATKSEAKTVTFSAWGTPFAVTAPARTIPYAQVNG